ncbi:hypothetical protein HZI73_23625 [Vallitalea pronyensis]|uniref:Uncharacterized protein n=1 Tax=Vallitalea pronyensis TaxID=1348613 RepID=A0A8J8MPD2_9FIRM|nr:hypothetical protein [Vallitalea pronyensis]QUI25102.1 hypothetical protein HZI73_23625 [Vallitalea pronyensis]
MIAIDEWSKIIWVSIDLMTAALILVSALTISRISRDFGRVQQQEINAVAVTKLYRTYNRYDNQTNLTPQDIITLIFETRGRPEIWVDTTAGSAVSFTQKWTPTSPSNMWDLTHITENVLPVTASYTSTIEKNANGEISRVEFRRD